MTAALHPEAADFGLLLAEAFRVDGERLVLRNGGHAAETSAGVAYIGTTKLAGKLVRSAVIGNRFMDEPDAIALLAEMPATPAARRTVARQSKFSKLAKALA